MTMQESSSLSKKNIFQPISIQLNIAIDTATVTYLSWISSFIYLFLNSSIFKNIHIYFDFNNRQSEILKGTDRSLQFDWPSVSEIIIQ